jgi:AbrB family looped-hinge helix DNA binding protein
MSGSEQKVVSVSKHGQATIPKRFREKLGISAPGRVKFREQEDGSIVVESVPTPEEMRGFGRRHGDATTDKSATELLREDRGRDKREREERFFSEEE